MTTPKTVTRTRVLMTIAELEARVRALENLADTAAEYYLAFIVGQRRPKTDRLIETEFIIECQRRLSTGLDGVTHGSA